MTNDYEIVDLPSDSQHEHWLELHADGKVKEVHENDGYRCLRKGLQTQTTWGRVEDYMHIEGVRQAWAKLQGVAVLALETLDKACRNAEPPPSRIAS